MQVKSILVLIVIVIVVHSGCTKAIIDEGNASDILNRTIFYESDVQDIIFGRCIACHGGLSPSADLDLTTYESVRSQTENGSLLTRINDAENPMPPSGLLTQLQRDIIAKWADDGYLEN